MERGEGGVVRRWPRRVASCLPAYFVCAASSANEEAWALLTCRRGNATGQKDEYGFSRRFLLFAFVTFQVAVIDLLFLQGENCRFTNMGWMHETQLLRFVHRLYLFLTFPLFFSSCVRLPFFNISERESLGVCTSCVEGGVITGCWTKHSPVKQTPSPFLTLPPPPSPFPWCSRLWN